MLSGHILKWESEKRACLLLFENGNKCGNPLPTIYVYYVVRVIAIIYVRSVGVHVHTIRLLLLIRNTHELWTLFTPKVVFLWDACRNMCYYVRSIRQSSFVYDVKYCFQPCTHPYFIGPLKNWFCDVFHFSVGWSQPHSFLAITSRVNTGGMPDRKYYVLIFTWDN